MTVVINWYGCGPSELAGRGSNSNQGPAEHKAGCLAASDMVRREERMTVLVTGAAGFIGSTLVESLLTRGANVRGIDCFTPYYDPDVKRANLAPALDRSRSPRLELMECDLRTAPLEDLLEDVDIIYHQAGQPGVRLSWSQGFETYASCNVLATQRLLEAAVRVGVERIVYASSSSIYGNAPRYPVDETILPRPHSPYGVTKLAGEHLCALYAENHGLSTVSLRYFTVYGPRQRPDMAVHRLIKAALDGTAFPLFGDGSQVRDLTYVDDVVAANHAAAAADTKPGLAVNICTGGHTRVAELIELTEEAVRRPVLIDHQPDQPGDVRRTGGDGSLAFEQLGWEPRHTLAKGVAAQAAWQRARKAASR